MSKLVYKMIFVKFAIFSIFGLFFTKGTDDQERELEISTINLNIKLLSSKIEHDIPNFEESIR